MSARDQFHDLAERVQLQAFGRFDSDPFLDFHGPHDGRTCVTLCLDDLLIIEDAPDLPMMKSAVRAWLLCIAQRLADAADRLASPDIDDAFVAAARDQLEQEHQRYCIAHGIPC